MKAPDTVTGNDQSVLLAQAGSGKVALSRSRPPAGTPANYAGRLAPAGSQPERGAGRQPLGGVTAI